MICKLGFIVIYGLKLFKLHFIYSLIISMFYINDMCLPVCSTVKQTFYIIITNNEDKYPLETRWLSDHSLKVDY